MIINDRLSQQTAAEEFHAAAPGAEGRLGGGLIVVVVVPVPVLDDDDLGLGLDHQGLVVVGSRAADSGYFLFVDVGLVVSGSVVHYRK